ncbi:MULTISPECIES: methyl-accepting chemotaxis protein [unclassified Oceanispirochaeta]|uniref:methyl-accepting chemotaxis protein n=1 Tax=unclassified Oceanispirochaeta TaxID=2635722 RepID=UPI0013142EB6|nr:MULTISPECIES: methyl-accepting chemotaxis protein [unclassified Oceanispirochaeta]
MFKLKLKLKGKLLIPILGIFILGVILVQGFSYYKTVGILEAQIEDGIIREAASSTRFLDQWVDNMSANLINWSREDLFQEALEGDEQAIMDVFTFTGNGLIDFPWYEGLALVGLDGKVIAASPDSYADLDVSDRDYFKDALKGGQGKSEPLVSKATGHPIFVISNPITDNNNSIKGVIFAVISISDLYDMVLSTIKIGDSGYAFMTDPYGMIIGHPNKDYILSLDISNTNYGQYMVRNKTGIFKYYFEEQKQWKLMAFSEVKGADWIIAVTAPLGELMQPMVIVRNTTFIGGLITIIASGLIILLIVGQITKSIVSFVSIFKKIAEGDLQISLSTKEALRTDELGDMARSINDMVPRLRNVISDVQSSAYNVATGSNELSSSSVILSEGASQQASSIEEVSSSMEQMAANIDQNAENAIETDRIATQSAVDAEEGGRSVQQSVEAMKSIAEKISVIEEIARQTNLLALNAAIEAARAGEHGKGFAVVASEVRKLAEHSGTAATEIGELSYSSVKIAEKAGEMLDKLVPDIQKTASLIQEISSASKEQSMGAEQINTAIQQLDMVIQQNASASEEMAATSEELTSQSRVMQDSIAFFKISDESGTHSSDNAKLSLSAPDRPE